MSVERCDQDLLTDMRDASCIQAISVATRLKLIREAFGISQRELAKRAGITNSSISMIELGQVSPSIQSLERILSVVPISLSDFFGFNPISTVRVNRVSTPPFPPDSRAFPLVGDHLVGSFVIIPPDGVSGLRSLAHDACGLVVEGEVQLKSIAAQELLNEGDTFYIPARQLHCFINQGKFPLRLFICSHFVRS